MKLYKGDLVALLEKALPTGITFRNLGTRFRVKVFLDSFNEMPRDQLERDTHEADILAFLSNYPGAGLIIGSRTGDGLSKFEFPTYWLDEIDEDFLDCHLQQCGIAFNGRFADEIKDLLKKPFYFQLVTRRSVKLPEQPHPRDLYRSLFANLSAAFADRFGKELDLARALAPAAYEAINRGEEALPVQVIYQSLKKELQLVGLLGITPEDAGHWLVSKSMLQPYSGSRVAFFHQSVTEFLAASELADRFRSTPKVLKEKLSLRQWDQALFLTLSILPNTEATAFLDAVIDADFVLALRATKYLEVNREVVVARLLAEIPRRIEQRQSFDMQIESALEFHVPVAEAHEAQLRTIMKCGNAVGGEAAAKLLHLKGMALKSEMLATLLERRSDFNYCSRLGQALQPFVRKEDLNPLVVMADSMEREMTDDDEDRATQGFVTGASEALAKVELTAIAAALLPDRKGQGYPKARVRIVIDCIRHRHTTEALNLAADLLLTGFREAATSIYFIAKFARVGCTLSWTGFNEQHVTRLVELLGDTINESWGLQALKSLCNARKDLAPVIAGCATKAKGLRRAALFHALGTDHDASVFSALNDFATMEPAEREREPAFLLKHMELDWTEHEDLFLRLLRLRNTRLALCLLESVARDPIESQIGTLDIGDITWWLDWLADPNDPKAQWWFQDRLSSLFARKLIPQTQNSFLAEFNRKDSKYRDVLAEVYKLASNAANRRLCNI
jgi:hypothetical protein